MLKTKNTIFAVIFLIFSFYQSSAQEIVGGNPSYPPDPYNVIDLDITQQNIFYEYIYVRNPERKSNTRSSMTVLQVGANYSKFVDYYTLKLDSLREKHSKLNRVEKNEMNDFMTIRNEIGFKMTVLKNFKKSNFTIQSRIPSNNYEFELEQPELNWKLESEHKTILGYKTQKATVFYSGRNWIAWFADSIPINLGPYTFGNLPGLILELYDDEKNFHFIASGINNQQEKIYKRNEENIVITSKSIFFRTEKSFHEKPDLFFNTESVEGVNNFSKIPYNPIELDN